MTENNPLSVLFRLTDEQGSHIYADATGENFIRAFTSLIERQTQIGKRKGILVSTLWSANALSRRLSLSKLSKGSLKVIDTVSLMIGSHTSPGEDIHLLSPPVHLESLMIGIERILMEHPGEYTFLVFDSLDTLMRRHDPSRIRSFFEYIMNRMLEEEITVIVFDQNGIGAGRDEGLISLMDHRIDMTPEAQ